MASSKSILTYARSKFIPARTADFTAPDTTLKTTQFSADYDSVYLLGDCGPGSPAQAIYLPDPKVGAFVRFIVAADLDWSGNWLITTPALTLPAVFASGTQVISASATAIDGSSVPHHGAVLVETTAGAFSISGDRDGGGGIGSTVTFYGVQEPDGDNAGKTLWLMRAFMCCQGTGAVRDTSTFTLAHSGP